MQVGKFSLVCPYSYELLRFLRPLFRCILNLLYKVHVKYNREPGILINWDH
jgi:hypothetical protein